MADPPQQNFMASLGLAALTLSARPTVSAPTERDLLIALAGLAGAFIVLNASLAIHRRSSKRDASPSPTTSGLGWLAERGGLVPVLQKLVWVAGCAALAGLALTRVVRLQAVEPILAVSVYLYLSILSSSSLFASKYWRVVTVYQLEVIGLLAFLLYAYLDLYPLTLVGGAAPSTFAWARIGLLFLVGVVVPLAIPREWLKADPDPTETASWGSYLTFGYLDRIIIYASRHPHVPVDEIPPLQEADSTEVLVEKHFKQIDPILLKKRRRIYWSLLIIFRRDYAAIFALILILVASAYVAPIGIRQLLVYLEGDQPPTVHPWVWIAWIGLGPLIETVATQFYMLHTTRVVAQAEAMITQLVFTHALRIRMQVEPSSEKKSSAVSEAKKNGKDEPTATAVAPIVVGGAASEAGPSQTVEAAADVATGAAVVDTDNISTTTGDTAVQDASSTSTASPTSTAASLSEEGASKGKGKSKKQEEEGKKDKKALTGLINNLITSDLKTIVAARDFLALLESGLHVIGSVIFLYIMLGWSALVGTAIIFISLPIPAWTAKLIMSTQKKKMKASDARVQAVTQMMGVLRMIKLFAWEKKTLDNISEKREEELKWIWYGRLLGLVNYFVNTILPLSNVIATFAIFTLVMKQELTASRIFTSMAVFEILRSQMFQLMYLLPMILRAKVSIDRLADYLDDTELLDAANGQNPSGFLPAAALSAPAGAIGFEAAHFTWLPESKALESPTPGGTRNFRLVVDERLLFEHGGINLIVGPTGSGKTSLLLALLGEMRYHPTGPHSWYNLPREGGVAYACQESWVLNETIRENILFGTAYDEERYQKVLTQCALTHDLSLFEAGDSTEVGEKGLTLSGGQKARITLARAVYSHAQVVLLDDILAALDVHTAREIVEKCLQGDLLRGRTVLLVSHNLALTSSLAHKVIQVQGNGHVTGHSSFNEVLELDPSLRAEVQRAEAEVDKSEKAAAPPENQKSGGKLTVAEEVAHGAVGWKAVSLYLSNLGSPFFWVSWVTMLVGEHLLSIYQPFFLGQWSSQYERMPASEVPASRYLAGYGLIVVLELAVGITGYIIWTRGNIRASRRIHVTLLQSIFGATLRWLDTVPSARVLARCTQDIQSVDQMVAQMFNAQFALSMALILKFIAVIYVVGWRALISGVVVSASGYWVGRIYVAAQRSVKREQSNAKSPILSLVGAALGGLPSIRAYGAQDKFKSDLMKRINVHTRLSRTFFNLNRWIGIRMSMLGSLFAVVVAAGVVYGNVLNSGRAGFALSQVLAFAQEILWWVRVSNMLEVECNSLERLNDFINCEQEPKSTPAGVPAAYWPASGSLRAENLGARYSKESPEVLHDVSFDIKAGERVGVVGRTGAGKSTVSLALLRGILTSGTVLYDGVDINKINLDALRANITLIPQHPELMAGTLRENLDPFGDHDDATLNDSLRSAGLFRLQRDDDPAAITLDSDVEGGGANFSHGQRQIIALARAQVRRSKLMIMDEATAAIDYETDAVIQESIRTTLGDDVTIITIAHRLQTIMDSDKIMVLDSGRLVEFGSPKTLLEQKSGLFFELVERSHDKETLYRMIRV